MNTEAFFDAEEWYAGYWAGANAAANGDDIDWHTRHQYSTSEWMDGFLSGYEEVVEEDD